MAASGKKKGKVKGKTLNLTEFLSAGEKTPGTNLVYSNKSSWADEAADNDGGDVCPPWDGGGSSSNAPIALPTAPKSAQAIEIDKSLLPDKPPYTIFLGNLPFDLSTDDIKKFLSQANCNVADVRLPREGDSQRPKGFGYAEIDDIDSLYKALTLNDTQLRNRRIKVDLASQAQSDGKGGFDKTASDWRKSDRSDSPWNRGGDRYDSSNRQSESDRDVRWRDRGGSDNADSYGGGRGGYGGRDRGYDGDRGFSRDRGGGGGYERNYEQSGGGFDRNSDRGGSEGRGFGREWDRDRGYSDRGGYSRGPDRGQDFERGGSGGGGGFERRGGQDRGYDRAPERGYERSDRGGYDRGSDRGYDRGPSRGGGYDKEEGRDAWRRGGDEGGPPRREADYGPSDREAPRERKKLVLQKRTQPIEPAKAPAAVGSASIFGGAKPVDTAAKEREIELRLERERRDAEQQNPPIVAEKEVPRKEGSQEQHVGRVRRDSERSEGREGRTRHSSSGSGRGGPRPVIMRRESERSTEEEVFHKDDQAPVSPTPTSPPPPKTPTSPRQEDNVKLIPAPPPKENAWAKRSETVAVPSSGAPAGSPRPNVDRPAGEPAPRRDGGSDRPRGGGAPAPRGGGRGAGGSAWGRGQGPRPADGGGRGGGQAGRGERRAPAWGDDKSRSRPQHHEQQPPAALPKVEDPKPKDWSDANKFSMLLEDEAGNLSD